MGLAQELHPRILLPKNVLLQIVRGLRQIVGSAQIAPIIFVGAEGEDVFALAGEAKIGGDDGEHTLFGEHGQ